MLVRAVMKRLFLPWKTKGKKARFARAPHYNKYTVQYAYSTIWPDCFSVVEHVLATYLFSIMSRQDVGFKVFRVLSIYRFYGSERS